MRTYNDITPIDVIFQIDSIEGFEPFKPAVLVWGGLQEFVHKGRVYLPYPAFSTVVKGDSIEFVVNDFAMESFLNISAVKSKQIKGKFKLLTENGETNWNKFDAIIRGSK